MTKPVVLLSMALGVVWHATVVLLMGGDIAGAFTWRMIAGAVAGVGAGAFTVRSRQRRQGRESFLDGVATYYLAVGIYWVCLATIGVVSDLYGGKSSPGIFTVVVGGLSYVAIYATAFGIVLVPLCFVTRHMLWGFHLSMQSRPRSPLDPVVK